MTKPEAAPDTQLSFDTLQNNPETELVDAAAAPDIEFNLADYDCCDEHENTFPRGGVCYDCAVEEGSAMNKPEAAPDMTVYDCDHINHHSPALLIPCPQCRATWKYVKVHPDYLVAQAEALAASEQRVTDLAELLSDAEDAIDSLKDNEVSVAEAEARVKQLEAELTVSRLLTAWVRKNYPMVANEAIDGTRVALQQEKNE